MEVKQTVVTPDKAQAGYEIIGAKIKPLLILRALCIGLMAFASAAMLGLGMRTQSSLYVIILFFLILPAGVLGLVRLGISVSRKRREQRSRLAYLISDDTQAEFDRLAGTKRDTRGRMAGGILMGVLAPFLFLLAWIGGLENPVWLILLYSLLTGLAVFISSALLQPCVHARRDALDMSSAAAHREYAAEVQNIFGQEARYGVGVTPKARDYAEKLYRKGNVYWFRHSISCVRNSRPVLLWDARVSHDVGETGVRIDFDGIMMMIETGRQIMKACEQRDLYRKGVAIRRMCAYPNGDILVAVSEASLFPEGMKDVQDNLRRFRSSADRLIPLMDDLTT